MGFPVMAADNQQAFLLFEISLDGIELVLSNQVVLMQLSGNASESGNLQSDIEMIIYHFAHPSVPQASYNPCCKIAYSDSRS